MPTPAHARRPLVQALTVASASLLGRVVGASAAEQSQAAPPASAVHFGTQRVGGVDVYYREAGPASAPAILLLHGFPSAGHMFRDLIPALSDRYRLIAPDLPGFGETEAPGRDQFVYSFANLARTMEGFVDALHLQSYAIYIFDYGAPTGLRLALAQPDRVRAIISQNGNAYVEGLSGGWAPIQRYWNNGSRESREALRGFLTPAAVREQYVTGVPDPTVISRDGSNLDSFFLSKPGRDETQLDLFYDYRTNVELYPQFQAYFRSHKPRLLAVWGKNDPFFVPAGAEAFKRDLPEAQVHFLDTGHFALESHHAEIAARIRQFLS